MVACAYGGDCRVSITTEELKTHLATLPPTERAELAHYLIETLDEEEDSDAEAAWQEVLSRRTREIPSGSAIGEPAESVFARLRRYTV
jgi:putative addiction module component (TIGR02574 family)